MPETEPKPRLVELVAPGQGQGWKAVLKSGHAVVIHEIPVPAAEAAAAIPRIQRLADHRHPALSPILAWGTDPNGIWVAVEPNEGTPLGTMLTRGPLTPPAAAALGAAVLSGVAALHDAGIAMGGFGAAAIRVTGNGEVRLAGHPAAAVRGAPAQSDLRADVRSCGMAVCAAFGVDPAGAPAPPNIPPGLVVTMRSMASGAMGPAADRAQGALREMASALLAPDRMVAAQSELALRAGGRETPGVTPFLPSQPTPPQPVPAPAPYVPPVPKEDTPVRAAVSYDPPPRPMQTYPSIPAPTFAPQPPTPAAPPPEARPSPVPTWSEVPPRNATSYDAPVAPVTPAAVTPPPPAPAATNPPAPARETAPPPPAPFVPGPPPAPFVPGPPPAGFEPAGTRSPFETAAPPAASPPAATVTNPPAPAAPAPPQQTWAPVEAPAWTPGPPEGVAPLAAAASSVSAPAPAAASTFVPPAPARAPAREPSVARRPAAGGPSERPAWMIPAAIAVVVVILLGAVGIVVLRGRGGSSGGTAIASPSAQTSPKASPKASPSPTQGPLAVPDYGPATAAPITKVMICSAATPCNVPGSPAETATACDLSACHVEVAIYFSSAQRVPVSYVLKFFDRCTGTTTDLPGPNPFTPPGYTIAIPADRWLVNLPSGVKSGALVAVAQQPAVAASAPLLLGAASCA